MASSNASASASQARASGSGSVGSVTVTDPRAPLWDHVRILEKIFCSAIFCSAVLLLFVNLRAKFFCSALLLLFVKKTQNVSAFWIF